MLRKSVLVFSVLIFGSNACSPAKTLEGAKYLKNAERIASEGKLDEAIDEYQKHIALRLSVDDRPEWENPNFYLLAIGDLQLKKGNLEEALQSYALAEKKGVEKDLVTDRYRNAGSALAEKGDLSGAIQVLKKYRERDPLLIDSMLDRIAREMVAKEDKGINPSPTSAPKNSP